MSRSIIHILLLKALVLLGSCGVWQVEYVEPEYYSVDKLPEDSVMLRHILPYKTSIDSSMGVVLAQLPFDLQKGKPNGSLGLWMADACLRQCERYDGIKADVAILNQGGIRRPYLKAGPVTLGDLYELMPFENRLIRIRMTGEQLQEALEYTARRADALGGAGVWIQDTAVVKIEVGGKPLDKQATYLVLCNDYMYNGGDGYGLLQQSDDLTDLGLLREAFIEDIRQLEPEQLPEAGAQRIVYQP